MKAFSIIAAAAAYCALGCSPPSQPEPNPGGPVSAGIEVGDYRLGAPIESGNVTVVPVMLKDVPPPRQDPETITLAEARKMGKVEIVELPGQEEVGRLRVRNMADRPLLLIGGELLLGGKQDRIVAHDVVIPPGKTMDVEVDCVEHGRWEGTSQHFDYSRKIVPSAIRDAAAYEDQGAVWDKVGGFNLKARASNSSGTIQGGLGSPQVESRVRADIGKLSASLPESAPIVGVIYVLNGEVRSMDLFSTAKSFQSSKDGLLHGYLAEGALDAKTAAKDASPDDLRKFLARVVDGRREKAKDGDVYYLSTEGVRGNEVREQPSAGAAGKLIHGNYSNTK